ncbi:ABATE domain-containing protein [Bradyrhizobium sp. AZCC 1699]|uniref:ABATE domain-containing protein n=1 Tax=Bradyrhizobium sp. AZCC 1699 TaxID=3117024 RepID=UPI002FF2068F
MSKLSRQFKVPDELANLYDFANTLDLRHFTHHGVRNPQGDELANARGFAVWMRQRGLLLVDARVSPTMHATALELRHLIRDYLQRDPPERGKNRDSVRRTE